MEEIIRQEYADFLTEDEIQLVLSFHELTKDDAAAISLCSDLKRNFYGKTFGKTDVSAVNDINNKIAVYVCLSLVGEDEDYFESLSTAYQDEMIALYEDEIDENALKVKLFKLLDIEPQEVVKKPVIHQTVVKKEISSEKPVKKIQAEKKEPKRSLLGRLKFYQAQLAQKAKEGKE